MSKEEDKRIPFTSGGGFADDIMDWVTKVQAMNEAINALLWYETREGAKGGAEAISWHGETLCGILGNYAEAIELKLHENWELFGDIENRVVFPLNKFQYEYGCVKETSQPSAIRCIDENLKKLTDFIDNAAVPALHLKNAFEEVKKRILAEQEKAPVTLKAV